MRSILVIGTIAALSTQLSLAKAVAAPSEPVCAAPLLGICFNHYTEEEEAERETLAVLEAELNLRKHVHYSKGLLSIDEGIFTTTFPATPISLSITCSYDDGMQVNFKNDKKSASVRISMDDVVCSGIAKRIGPIVERLIDGQ